MARNANNCWGFTLEELLTCFDGFVPNSTGSTTKEEFISLEVQLNSLLLTMIGDEEGEEERNGEVYEVSVMLGLM